MAKMPKQAVPTGVGAGSAGLAGLWLAGPVGGLVGAVVGGAVGWFEGQKIAKAARTLVPPSALSAVHLGADPTPHISLADQVAQTGPAVPSAQALYAYLKAHGTDGSASLNQLVGTFQSATNADPGAVTVTGPIPVTGVYDVKTSAALSVYTHDPIAAATPPAASPPPPPAQAQDYSIPGSASVSGSNLLTYLQAHGNDGSANLHKLVAQFQLDFNTDPKFPGPAAALPLTPLIKAALSPSGVFDRPTANALGLGAPDPSILAMAK